MHQNNDIQKYLRTSIYYKGYFLFVEKNILGANKLARVLVCEFEPKNR
jgi:hypothetical protein